LDGIAVRDLKVPVVTNVEAEINTLKERVKGLLVAQVSSPVRWEESILRMTEDGIEQVFEIGPGKVLSGLMKRINPKVETKNLEDIPTLKKISSF
jgi:[acyl-carrier-protein] S-malonyltransferase